MQSETPPARNVSGRNIEATIVSKAVHQNISERDKGNKRGSMGVGEAAASLAAKGLEFVTIDARVGELLALSPCLFDPYNHAATQT